MKNGTKIKYYNSSNNTTQEGTIIKKKFHEWYSVRFYFIKNKHLSRPGMKLYTEFLVHKDEMITEKQLSLF